MLDQRGFDCWSGDYDRSVSVSEERNTYPFAGYGRILERIYRKIMEKSGARVLDVGFGTGTLTNRLYQNGCRITGVDFSEQMIRIAGEKMPGAELVQWDFSKGLPPRIREKEFDFVVCTYAIHHLDLPGKISLIRQMRQVLGEDGKIFIGDVAFETQQALTQCRQDCGGLWDDEEIYPTVEELKPWFPDLEFELFSFCSGVYTIGKQT